MLVLIKEKDMITKKIEVDYLVGAIEDDHTAITLSHSDVYAGADGEFSGYSERTHSDGWTIKGLVIEDYYLWVNEFEATHEVFGRVWGNFDSCVYADSEEGYQNFIKTHPYTVWDYWDI